MRDTHRGRRQIKEAIAAKIARGVQLVETLRQPPERFGIVVLAAEILQMPREIRLLVFVFVGFSFGKSFSSFAPELIVAHLRAREAQHAKSRRQAGVIGQIEKRGQQLALRQVARSAEHHDGARIVGNLAIIGVVLSLFRDFNGLRVHHRTSGKWQFGTLTCFVFGWRE